MDEDHPVQGDIVPVSLDFKEFMVTVDKVIVHSSNKMFEVPAVEIVLAETTRETSTKYVGPLVEALVKRKCIFVDPPYAVLNYCVLKSVSVVNLSYLSLPINRERLKGSIIIMFNACDDDALNLVSMGYHVTNFVLCPYYPQAVKFLKSVRPCVGGVDTVYFFGRKTVKMKYNFETRFERYMPVQWASYFGIRLGALFREWSCYEVRSDLSLRCSYPRRCFFNYVVEACALGESDLAPISLPVGRYTARDIPDIINVTHGFGVRGCDFVSLDAVSDHDSDVKLLVHREEKCIIFFDQWDDFRIGELVEAVLKKCVTCKASVNAILDSFYLALDNNQKCFCLVSELGRLKRDGLISSREKLRILHFFKNYVSDKVFNVVIPVVIRTHDGFPYDIDYFVLRGNYYSRDSSIYAKVFNKCVNHTIITEMSNMRMSLVTAIVNVPVGSLNFTFHNKGELAYRQSIMCNPVQNFEFNVVDNLQFTDVDLGVVPFLDM
jgi:hypothetical protein